MFLVLNEFRFQAKQLHLKHIIKVKRLYLENAKVFFSGENLHTWDHLPEGLETDMLTQGAWQYPFMRKYSIGINVTF